MTTIFNPRVFWDGVDLNKSRYAKYSYLYVNLRNALRVLSKDSNLKKESKPRELMAWVLHCSGRPKAGKMAEDRFFKMCRSLSEFSYISFMAKKEEKMLKADDLDEKGFSENLYLNCLGSFSEFIAWAYVLQIPNKIECYYKQAETPIDPSELEKEKALLNSEKDLSDNPSPRFPAIIIIDNALYMEKRLKSLESGLEKLFNEIKKDTRLANAIELYIATCGGGAHEIVDFSTIGRQELRLSSLDLSPFGVCKMASTINLALDKLNIRIDKMKNEDFDVEYWCPWLIVLSDGKFSEDMSSVCNRLKQMKEDNEIQVYPIGISSLARIENLKLLDSEEAGILHSIDGFFKDVFNSIKLSQNSSPGGTRISLIHQESFIKK